jgi:N-acyl homoserine lactone hydrolase
VAKRRTKLWALGIFLGASVAFATTFCAAPLPPPPPLTAPLPSTTPPTEMKVVHLPTGVTHRSAWFAYRGGSLRDARDFAMSAALVRHPRGDVLIDTGFGRNIDAQFRTMPFYFRATTTFERGTPAADQLDAAKYDRKKLRGVLLTHAHWDHASGIPDFAGTPILVTAEEHRFIDTGGWITRVAREGNGRYEEYTFEGGPYLGFDRQHDVHGDGSIVVVPAPGHTPGSVIVFVTLPDRRYAFVGDLAWQSEGIAEREERPWLFRSLADTDAAEVRVNLLRMNAIAQKYPQIAIVPAHDARAFASIPKL